LAVEERSNKYNLRARKDLRVAGLEDLSSLN